MILDDVEVSVVGDQGGGQGQFGFVLRWLLNLQGTRVQQAVVNTEMDLRKGF